MHVYREIAQHDRPPAKPAPQRLAKAGIVVSAGEVFGNLYQTTATDIDLRVRIVDGRVALELLCQGNWVPFGPRDILEVTKPSGYYGSDVMLHVADIVDGNGMTEYEVWGETELGVMLPAWTRTETGICCKLPVPATSDQVNWIKFTIGATPRDPQVRTPVPADPIGIIRKER